MSVTIAINQTRTTQLKNIVWPEVNKKNIATPKPVYNKLLTSLFIFIPQPNRDYNSPNTIC